MAVHLDDPTRAAVAEAVSELRAGAGALPVSWVARENFHVTVKFLGTVDEARVPSIVTVLQTVAAGHTTFAADVCGLGAFPFSSRARVLWAGIADGREPLSDLAGAVDEALAKLGFPAEGRALAPHVTVGRVRAPRRAPGLASVIEAGRTRRFGRVDVNQIALMRSDLSPRGARYTTLAAFPLSRA